MQWGNQFHVDLALPFGLCSALHNFNLVAHVVEWVLINSCDVHNLLHYLDDFITASPPNSDQFACNLNMSVTVCKSLGLPLHPDECLAPSLVLLVLSTEFDSNDQLVRLSADKFLALQELIASWRFCHWCISKQ